MMMLLGEALGAGVAAATGAGAGAGVAALAGVFFLAEGLLPEGARHEQLQSDNGMQTKDKGCLRS